MASVKGSGNRSTERRLRFALVRAGLKGWRLHFRQLPGKPDFFFPKESVVVFADGCFWHGCRKCGHVPNKRSAFWAAKIRRNRLRDRSATRLLRDRGFVVLRFWEHEIETPRRCVERVRSALRRSTRG
jgi:DNA mismatch endonuclease (patch repair protein)